MILKAIEIFDFKSVKHEVIDVKSNQICLVGINESGKSSILEAISFLNVEKDMTPHLLNKSSERYPNGYPLIIATFEFKKELAELFLDYTDVYSSPEQIIVEDLYINFERWGNGFDHISIILTNFVDTNINVLDRLENPNLKSKFLDTFFQDHFPIVELFSKEDLLLEPVTIEELQGDEPQYETFRRLLFLGGCKDYSQLNMDNLSFFASYINSIEKKVNRILKKHYKQDESISITIRVAGNNRLVLLVSDGSEQSFSIEERSPGFQYYFSFLVNKLYYNEFYRHRDIIFLLDEPGNNLHPRGAKDLLKTFDEISSKSLIVYTTHNPFLVVRNDLNSLLFVSKTHDSGTKVNRKPWLNRYEVLRKELGILLNDSFLVGEMNLLVEGVTEKYVLHAITQKERFRHLEWLNIYNVAGVHNMTQALNYLGPKNLDQNGVLLFDSDDGAKNEKGKKGFKDIIASKKWDYLEVNDVFDNKDVERTFEDLFPSDVYVEAFNEYCNSLTDIEVFDKPYQNLEVTKKMLPPIIKTVESHFYSFINENNKKNQSMSKQEIMRYLFDLIEKDGREEKVLQKLYSLVDIIDTKIKIITKHVGH